jgi:hypothetical protein
MPFGAPQGYFGYRAIMPKVVEPPAPFTLLCADCGPIKLHLLFAWDEETGEMRAKLTCPKCKTTQEFKVN